MALFPLFISLKNKKILIVGGGDVALRKIEKLIPFEPEIKVVSKDFPEKTISLLKKYNIPYEKRAFRYTDLENTDIVIVAVNNLELQKDIYNYTRGKNILVNSVDSPDYCDFIFPAYVKKGDLVIGITTSGKVPGLSGKIRKKIEKCLPEDIEQILEEIYKIRNSLPKGKERQEKILSLVEKLVQ